MEEKIRENLEKKYNFDIEVEWKGFRQYKIMCFINGNTIKIFYTYDVKFTMDWNMNCIMQKIDSEIIKLFKKEVK